MNDKRLWKGEWGTQYRTGETMPQKVKDMGVKNYASRCCATLLKEKGDTFPVCSNPLCSNYGKSTIWELD